MSYNNSFNWDEYNNLNKQKWDVENKIRIAETRQQLFSGKIQRLQQIKTIVLREKENFEDLRSSLANSFYDYDWKGDTHEKFIDKKIELTRSQNLFMGDIKNAIRALNDRIADLQNQSYKNDVLLGQLHSTWNNVWNALNNL